MLRCSTRPFAEAAVSKAILWTAIGALACAALLLMDREWGLFVLFNVLIHLWVTRSSKFQRHRRPWADPPTIARSQRNLIICAVYFGLLLTAALLDSIQVFIVATLVGFLGSHWVAATPIEEEVR